MACKVTKKNVDHGRIPQLDIGQRSTDHGYLSPKGYIYSTTPVPTAQRTS